MFQVLLFLVQDQSLHIFLHLLLYPNEIKSKQIQKNLNICFYESIVKI